MVARQQTLQNDHAPPRLNAIRPNKPRLVRHRITSLYSEMNHECTQTANSFTRSKAGTHTPRLLVLALWQSPSATTKTGGYGSRRSPGRRWAMKIFTAPLSAPASPVRHHVVVQKIQEFRNDRPRPSRHAASRRQRRQCRDRVLQEGARRHRSAANAGAGRQAPDAFGNSRWRRKDFRDG